MTTPLAENLLARWRANSAASYAHTETLLNLPWYACLNRHRIQSLQDEGEALHQEFLEIWSLLIEFNLLN